ncbi:MAG: FHA domain-containing protein [Actinobacteria bacterium]|nr:FHA domain-containing protein [Actinomycetota bacterium]
MKLPDIIINLLSYAFMGFVYLFLFIIFKNYMKSLSSNHGASDTSNPGKSLHLTVNLNSTDQRSYKVEVTDKIYIGRSPRCDIVLGNEFVSSRHAAIRNIKNEYLTIEDLQSTNGTHIEQRLIKGQVVLKTGMEIQIGKPFIKIEKIE